MLRWVDNVVLSMITTVGNTNEQEYEWIDDEEGDL